MRWFSLVFFLVGCRPDDVKDDTGGGDESADTDSDGGDDSSGGDDSAPGEETLVGDWLSEGDNVSYLLQSYNFVSVTASFATDGTYSVVGSTSNRNYTFTGTYAEDVSTTPHTVSLVQDAPVADTATGIWDVEDGTLTYEVSAASASTCTPPTVAGGFGSTDCPGQDYPANFNVQIFVAQ